MTQKLIHPYMRRPHTEKNVVQMPSQEETREYREHSHETALASMKKNRYLCRLQLKSGSAAVGVMHNFDRETISIIPEDADFPETFYKHAIESFTREVEGDDNE